MTKVERVARRRPTNKAAIVKDGDRELMVLLRDVSEMGARVRAVGSGTVPDRFQLVAPLEKLDKSCVVQWRRGSECGVRFE